MANKIKLKRPAGQQRRREHRRIGRPEGSPQTHLLARAWTLHQEGRLPEAEALYRQILLAEPHHPDALRLFGMLAHQTGESEGAVALLRKALTCRPDCVDTYVTLGVILHEQGRLDEAVASYRQALALQPEYAEVYSNLGETLKEQGKLDEAVASFRRAIALQPDSAETHYNLGNALKERGELEEAIASYNLALTLRPDYPEALNNLGSILGDQGKLEEAILCYRQALTLQPDYAAAHNNLGIALKEQGKLEEAIDSYNLALTLRPDYAEAHSNLGNVLKAQGKLEEAIACFRQAIALQPDYAEAYSNLGNAFNEQGKLEEAVACYHQAVTLQPNFFEAHSNLLLCLNYLPGQSISQYREQARHYARQATAKASGRFTDWGCSANPDRLRVGVVSGDFRHHPVGYFLENMLESIDAEHVDLIAYPTHYQEDELTARVRSRFSGWKPLVGMNDEAAAHLIHDDGIHILLDLAGHSRHNRLPVFAWKPAPIQATWLGYFASTGLAEMDYILVDPTSVPAGHQEHFTERVWYLPDTRLCFSPPAANEEFPLTSLPALRNEYITFGCFQNLAKINDAVLTAWGRIIHQVPRGRLHIQNRSLISPAIREEVQRRLAQRGIAPERVMLEKSVPRREYLAAHAHIDIILDTFPFPGGTTTCEALWMGVPTVTLAGKSMLARQGASLLACAGLADWIAEDEEDYVAKAVAATIDLERLARLRAGLRQQVLASPLFDAPRFARNFEEAMWGMWHRFRDES